MADPTLLSLPPEVRAAVEAIRAGIAVAEAHLDRLRTAEAALVAPGAARPGARPRRPGQRTQTEAAATVLSDAGGPLATNDLVRRIVDRGLYPDALDRKQLVNSFFSAMRRNKMFVKVAAGVWGLRPRDAGEDG